MLTSRSERVMRRSKSVGLRHSDREPYDAKEKVQHHNTDRELEGKRIIARWKVVDRDRNNEQNLGQSPNEGAEFDIFDCRSAGEVHIINVEEGDNVVRCRL